MLRRAFNVAQETTHRPTLIIVDSHIGWGAPQARLKRRHAGPLGKEEARLAKQAWGWQHHDKEFFVPPGVVEHFAQHVGVRGGRLHHAWKDDLHRYADEYPHEAQHLKQMLHGELPKDLESRLPSFSNGALELSTEDASSQVLNTIAEHMPWMIGGSADLARSVKTKLTFTGAGDFPAKDRGGRNIHFGVREHAMGAILNGLALCHARPFGSTYLIFSDYMRGAMRLSSMMELPVIYIFGHDSIGLGEDGPTHQPIEQLGSLRAIPHLITFRPADANEVVEAWLLTKRHLSVDTSGSRVAFFGITFLGICRYFPGSGSEETSYIVMCVSHCPGIISAWNRESAWPGRAGTPNWRAVRKKSLPALRPTRRAGFGRWLDF